jgi:hypothetical protein
VPSVVIAKMDATANDPPADIHLDGFPTIKVSVYMCVCIHTYVCACVCVCAYMHTYVDMCVYVCR